MPQSNHHMIAGELAEIIAGATTDPDGWQTFSKRFCELIPGTKTIFMANDRVAKRDTLVMQHGFEDSILEEFAVHYSAINPWMPFNAGLPILIPQRTERVLPAASFRKTGFYNDFLLRIGESDAATGLKIWGDGQRNAEFAVHYAARWDERLNAVIEPVLKAVGPVMSQSLATLRIRMSRDQDARKKDVVEAIADPAFILSKDGKVLSANASGQALASEAGFLRIVAGDRLDISDPPTASAVRRVIAKTLSGERLPAGQETIWIGHPGRTHALAIYPMTFHLGGSFGPLTSAEACVLLILRPLLQQARMPDELLRERFSLTAAEARLAMRLVTGASLPEASRTLNISYLTGKTQLKSIFAKLNVSRQAEMVALLLSVLP